MLFIIELVAIINETPLSMYFVEQAGNAGIFTPDPEEALQMNLVDAKKIAALLPDNSNYLIKPAPQQHAVFSN